MDRRTLIAAVVTGHPGESAVLAFASAMADCYGGRVVPVFVRTPMWLFSSHPDAHTMLEMHWADRADLAREQVSALLGNAAGAGLARQFGSLPDQAAALAADLGASVLVVGWPGRRPKGRGRGSVGLGRLLKRCPIPVVMVPLSGPRPNRRRGRLPWRRGRGPLRIPAADLAGLDRDLIAAMSEQEARETAHLLRKLRATRGRPD